MRFLGELYRRVDCDLTGGDHPTFAKMGSDGEQPC